MNRLAGRVAVVTGGTRGLGLAIARAYGRAGARAVVVASRSQPAVDAAVATLRAEGMEASGLAVDVSVRGEVDALRDLAVERYGTVDVWVNNAGVSGPYGPVQLVPGADFLTVTDTIVRGCYHGSVAALDVFVPQGSGHLVNLLGRGDKQPVPLQAAYASAKAWVRAFTLALAAEHRGSGVRVHAFNPGLVLTEMLGSVTAVRGFEGKLGGLPVVSGMWGRSADEAALPAVDLVCGDRVELRALGFGRIVTGSASYGLARVFGRAPDLPGMHVTVVEPRATSFRPAE